MEDNHTESDQHSTEIEQLRAELIAQDHRLFTTLRRYFIERKTWPKDDLRHAAVKLALIYAFFSPATIAIGGSVVALASLGVLLWQNSILIDQNGLIASQNEFMQEQIKSNNRQWLAERKASLLSILYDTKQCIDDEKKECPISSINARIEAVSSLNSLEKDQCKSKKCTLSLDKVNLSGAKLNGINLDEVNFYLSDLSETEFSLVRADNIKITNSKVMDMRFKRSNINNCIIQINKYGDKENNNYAEFSSSDLINCKIELPIVNFEACFSGSNLTGASITVGLVPPADEYKKENDYNFLNANLTGANLSQLRSLQPYQLQGACSNGGTELPFEFEFELPLCRHKNHGQKNPSDDDCSSPLRFFEGMAYNAAPPESSK